MADTKNITPRQKKGGKLPVSDRAVKIQELIKELDEIHIRKCLLEPYFATDDYPIVESRELLPSFEVDLYEHKELPGYSMVALARPIDYFNEVFQFDILHYPEKTSQEVACPLQTATKQKNLDVIRTRLPRHCREDFMRRFKDEDVHKIENYEKLLPFLLQMERAHVLSLDQDDNFYLTGVYGSLPSDLDTELKRFGMKIKKFRPGDSNLYELNRLFTYQYLMELYGFPMASERRTSAALFSRRLFRMGEDFMVRVQGQSDRTITTLYSHPKAKYYPRVDKLALVSVGKDQEDAIKRLTEKDFFVDREKRVVILRVRYRQHKYNPENIRQDRALSVYRQEIIHPKTGEIIRDLNIIKDATNMILQLNDIVRGEYLGLATYKRHELVQDTDSHTKRLKFLHTWLTKHQRRIIGYSDQFFKNAIKVLDSYMLSPDNYDIFKENDELYQEVWGKYAYILQARKVLVLENLQKRRGPGEKLNYLDMLFKFNEILNDLKYESVTYFENLIEHVIHTGEKVLATAYLRANYMDKPDDDLTEYGLKVKKQYSILVGQLDELKSIRKSKKNQA